MNLDFPISDIELEQVSTPLPPIENPNFTSPVFCVNDDEFNLDVIDVAQYQAIKGQKVLCHLYDQADKASVELFLQGSVFGAILHQRGILPLHGCSFDYMGKGIVICGHSGAGKSSVTMSFCLNGAELINDDISPVILQEGKPFVIPMKSKIKLWDNSLSELEIDNSDLLKIRPNMNKYYYDSDMVVDQDKEIKHFFILSIHNKNEYLVKDLSGMDKFNALRKQVYRRSYLKGMPDTEKQYFGDLFKIAQHTKVTLILRPKECRINDTMLEIEREIEK